MKLHILQDVVTILSKYLSPTERIIESAEHYIVYLCQVDGVSLDDIEKLVQLGVHVDQEYNCFFFFP